MEIFDLLRRQFQRRELGYEFLRIYLGLGLFARGVFFVVEPEVLDSYIAAAGASWAAPAMFAHLIVVAHLVGGLLLALGLMTRLAAAVQIPVVTGAILNVHLAEGLLGTGQALEFAALVLFMLGVSAMFGGGSLSLDRRLEVSFRERMLGGQLRPVTFVVRPTLHHHVHAVFEDDDEARQTINELTGLGLPLQVDRHPGGMWDKELVEAGLAHLEGGLEGPIMALLATLLGAGAGLLLIGDPLQGMLLGAFSGALAVTHPGMDEVVARVRDGGTLVHVDVLGDSAEAEVERVLHRHELLAEQHIAH